MQKTHHIKLLEAFAYDVLSGNKTFEIRFNDRGYQKGDLVRFKVIDKAGMRLLGHPLNNELFMITYVINGYGLENGYVVFGIKRVTDETQC